MILAILCLSIILPVLSQKYTFLNTLSTYPQKTKHLQQCIKGSWMLKPQEITLYMTLEKARDFGLMVARLLMRKREWVVLG